MYFLYQYLKIRGINNRNPYYRLTFFLKIFLILNALIIIGFIMKVVKSRAFKDRLKGHKQSVISLFSPFGEAGHMLYSISKDGSVRGWDLAKRQITIKALLDKKVKGKEQKEEQAIFQAEGKEQKKEQQQKTQIRDEIVSACFTEKTVFGSFEDGMIVEWSFTNQGQILNQFVGHTKRVSNLFVMNNLLVSGSHDGTIRTWNISNGQPQAVYKTSGAVNSIRPGENKTIYAIVSRNIFYEIDISSNKIVKCIKFNKHSISSFFCFQNLLVFGNIQNKILIYDLNSFDPQAPEKFTQKKLIEGLGGWVLTFQFLNNHLYAGCDDRKIRVYKWPQVEEVQELGGHDDGIISLSFADHMLYSGSYDHSIRSWDIKEMMQRIAERNSMGFEDIQSKKYEVYYGVVFKNKKKKLPSKKKK